MARNSMDSVPLDGHHVDAWKRSTSSWELGFLHLYPITMFLGVLISFLSIAWFWKRQKYSWEILQILLILIVPGAIFGARFWYLCSEGGWSQWYVLQGLSIQGGILGAFAFGTPFAYYRRHAIDIRTVIGIILPNIIIGQAIGRWGNFDNHEVFGSLISSDKDDTTLNWMGAMKSHMYIYIPSGPSTNFSVGYRHPLFFYEFISSSIGYIVIVLVLLRKNLVKPGVTAAVYLVWYGITRTTMEPLRDTVDIMRWGSLPISLLLSVLMIIGGVALFIWWQFLSKKEYDLIKPIKPRKEFFVYGKTIETKKKYVLFGEDVPNEIRIWLPNNEIKTKWSKRELNKGERSDGRK